jgi:CTP:phosphocholine cytidylyltransferase-like protein
VPNVQWKTPDDGQRNCPEHVEFLDQGKFGKISASVGFIKKNFVTMRGHMTVKLVNPYSLQYTICNSAVGLASIIYNPG